MRGLSLFAGIGASDIALALAGVELIGWSEIEELPSQIMRLRYPDAEELGDVRELDARGMAVDVVMAGFPCQDISNAGPRRGIKDGTRSSLWTQVDRIIDECRPQLVFLENVEAIRRRGLDIVLTDLADIGYEAAWDCIPAAAVGAPHLRDRWWCVAAPNGRLPWDIFGTPLEKGRGSKRAVVEPKEISSYVRLPRAGRMRDGVIQEMEPVAPKKLARKDGWSVWNGVRLLPGGASTDDRPLPTPTAVTYGSSNNGSNAGRPATGKGSLETMARHGLLPTPVSRDWKSGGFDSQLSGNASKGLWPTPVTTDAFGSRRATAKTEEWKSNDGITLSDAVIMDGDGTRLWPTPRVQDGTSGQDTARAERPASGGDDLVTRMYRNAPGMLHPDWVEWLMGLPIGWTNPDVPNDQLIHRDWSTDEGIPRTVPPRAGYPLRKERLQACGNTLVWPVLYWVVQRTILINADPVSAGSEAA